MAVAVSGFEPKLAALPETGAFVLFKADWCPDCVRSTGAVQAAVAAAGGSLLMVDVGQPMDWRAPSHPLRTDPRFALKGVPTLVHWKGGAVAAKLGAELEKAPSKAAAAEVAAAFVKQALA